MFFFTEPLKMTYNEDGDRMLKIAIIHGPNPMDGKDMDGEITRLETDDEHEQHIVTLVDFLRRHYKDDQNLQQLKMTHPIQTACYVFTRLGDIVFIDTTGANPKSHVGIGTFMMPEELTEKQKWDLKNFKIRLLITTMFVSIMIFSMMKGSSILRHSAVRVKMPLVLLIDI